MTNQIVEQLQPVIGTIVTAIIGVLASYALVAIRKLQGKAAALLEARTTVSDRETLHKIAQEAFAFAETTWKEAGGDAKLQAALAYASQKLQKQGIQLGPDEIKAAIHDAWLKFDQGQKAAGTETTDLQDSQINNVEQIDKA